MRTKEEYYIRKNPIIHGDKLKHYPSGTAILMDIIIRSIKYNYLKLIRK
jgi:hypothetical protein